MENEYNKNNQERGGKKPEREVARKNHDSYSIFDPFFDGFFRFPSFKNEFKELDKLMKTDIREHEKEYELEVEMPGFNKSEISLDLNNGYLTIEAKKHSSENENDNKGNYIRRERYYGSTARSFYVGDVDEDGIRASLEDGILHVIVPKEKKELNKKHIEIK